MELIYTYTWMAWMQLFYSSYAVRAASKPEPTAEPTGFIPTAYGILDSIQQWLNWWWAIRFLYAWWSRENGHREPSHNTHLINLLFSPSLVFIHTTYTAFLCLLPLQNCTSQKTDTGRNLIDPVLYIVGIVESLIYWTIWCLTSLELKWLF